MVRGSEKTMDHDHAMKSHAAERYLLDELSPEDRDDFEGHYFSCAQCADEVRTGFAFADNAKAVMLDEPRIAAAPAQISRRKSFFEGWSWLRPAAWAPVMAVLLLGVTLYQNVLVIPRMEQELADLSQPRAVPSVVARAATRGEDRPVQISKGDGFLQVILDIPPGEPVSSYTCEVYDAAGTLRFTVPAAAPSNGDSLHLSLPVAGLEAGRYMIRVKPGGEEYSFTLSLKSEPR